MIADIYCIPAKAEALPHEGGIGPCGPICLRKRALRNMPFWTTCCASSANAVPACQPICLSACQCGCASVRRVTHEPSLTLGVCGWAGATSTVGLYPLETLRTRLAMGDYDNMLHAVRVITAEEGFMAFYQVHKSKLCC